MNPALEGSWDECCKKYTKSISKISSSGGGKPLVDISDTAFCFDDYVADWSPSGECFCSADALFIKGKNIYLIEFKSGFSHVPNFESLPQPLEDCNTCKKSLERLRKQLVSNDHDKKENLALHIRIKILESYYILFNSVLPKIGSDIEHVITNFIIVADVRVNPIEALAQAMADLSEGYSASGLESHFRRYRTQNRLTKKPNFYNHVTVIPVDNFPEFFKEIKSK